MRKFRIDRNYYGDRNLFDKSMITIQSGVTVLVGCNGSGKTTLLKAIEEKLRKTNIPVVKYNNLTDGQRNSVEKHLYMGNTNLAAQMLMSSEGEAIVTNIGILASSLRKFIKNGTQTAKASSSNERWLLLDAVDSGMSIDNILLLKDLFSAIIKDGRDKEIYILVSANEYELANGEQCFDVQAGRYLTFENYESYRKFIIESGKKKEENI